MIRSTRTRRRLLALAAPVVLLVSACGGDDEEGTDDTAAVTEANDAGGVTTEPAETTAAAADTTGDTEATSVDTGEGFEFTSPAGDYTAVFPAEPTTSEQQAPTADGRTLPVTQHIAEADGANFATAELAIPEGEPYVMEAGRDGSVAAVGGELISSEEIEVDGREGVEFVASVESNGVTGTYISRILTDGETVYQLIVVAPGEVTADDEAVAAFFDSFAFTS